MVDGFQIVHGSPYDEDEYVIAADEASQAFSYLERRLAFFGHTHVQGGFIWNRSRVETIPRTSLRSDRHIMEIDQDCAYLVNPGSVGQPRDGDPRAAFALYDSDASDDHLFPGALRRGGGPAQNPRCRPSHRSSRTVCLWVGKYIGRALAVGRRKEPEPCLTASPRTHGPSPEAWFCDEKHRLDATLYERCPGTARSAEPSDGGGDRRRSRFFTL